MIFEPTFGSIFDHSRILIKFFVSFLIFIYNISHFWPNWDWCLLIKIGLDPSPNYINYKKTLIIGKFFKKFLNIS